MFDIGLQSDVAGLTNPGVRGQVQENFDKLERSSSSSDDGSWVASSSPVELRQRWKTSIFSRRQHEAIRIRRLQSSVQGRTLPTMKDSAK